MCFLTTMSGEEAVEPRCYRGQDWILPHKILLAVLAVSLILLLIGIILLAVHFQAVGGVLAGLGGCGLMILLLLCIHAYCCKYTRDVYTQTGVGGDTIDVPTYAVINKPSSLKRADSASKRNGRIIEKHVTLSPDTEVHDISGQTTIAPSNNSAIIDATQHLPVRSNPSYAYVQQDNYGHQYPIYKPSGQAYVPPAPMYRPPGYVNPTNQYPMQVYPIRAASSTSSSIRYGFDDDYDNPAESTPMLSYHSASSTGSMQSHGRSSAPMQSQIRSESSHQSSSITYKAGGSRQDQDIPEPQPLVYPSAKRPMTFEQTSSSKMSVYDNVLSAYPEEEE